MPQCQYQNPLTLDKKKHWFDLHKNQSPLKSSKCKIGIIIRAFLGQIFFLKYGWKKFIEPHITDTKMS